MKRGRSLRGGPSGVARARMPARVQVWAVGSALAVAVALVVTLGAGHAAAQEASVEAADLPQHVEGQVVDFFNDSGTIRFSGRSRVPAGRVIVGDVAVLGGPFTVGGTIRGTVIVVNGDLEIDVGGEITGDVLVVGGRLRGEDENIGGTATIYSQSFRYLRRGDGIRPAPDRRTRSAVEIQRSRWGRSRIAVRTGHNYNRVEGLPVKLGAIVESADPNSLRFDAFAIWRTDEGFDLDEDELGYEFRVEQRFGRERIFSVGATAHSEIEPIERWGLSDLEASLTTFLFHKDFRDYYERTGWSAFTRIRPPNTGIELKLEYRDEDQQYRPSGSPWSLKDNDAPWRAQPMIAEGEFRSVAAELEVDLRNDEDDPSDGWLLRANARFGVDGTLVAPALDVPAGVDVDGLDRFLAGGSFDSGFSTGFLDLRRYNRVGPNSELHLRGLLAGSLSGDPLPPQFQHALGGEGDLPGYPIFFGDCGARTFAGDVTFPVGGISATVPAFAHYGCDRVALFQVEYRSSFELDLDIGGDESESNWWVPRVDLDPNWAVFFNAGRGWVQSESPDDLLRRDTGTLVDAGVGFFLGDLGLYLATPLDGDIDRGVNFFVRLDHRF